MKRNILFVDDEQSVLDGFRTMMHLKRKEWKCHFAISGHDGLELLEKETFDVVIADMRMPGMDGADFLARVAKRQPGAIRMILSGYSDMPSLLKSAKIAHQFLSKPCSSDKIIKTIQQVIDLKEILADDSIRSVVARLDALPVVPDLFIQICEELQATEPNLKLIAKMIERDVGISATLLKVVNSSFFGFYEHVSSPARAVTLLGTETVKGLVLGVNFLNKIDTSALPDYSVAKLWEHSLQTGCFAKCIASMETDDKQFIDDCFLAGILHDVGKLIFVTNMDEIYLPVLECVRTNGGPIALCENEKLGVGHAEVGAYLLGLWGFKTEVVEGVCGHHSPELFGSGLTTSLIVHAANTIQHDLGVRSSEYVYSPINEKYLDEIGLGKRLETWQGVCKEKWSEHEE